METAEVKTKKRIKHAYRREELYHRFIHSASYAYSPKGRTQISCVGNYLVTGAIGKYQTIEDFEAQWVFNKERAVAIIDRENKIILINESKTEHSYLVRHAVPNDYTIYSTHDAIPSIDVLSDKYKCLLIHSTYLVDLFFNWPLSNFYRILQGKGYTLNINIDDVFNEKGLRYNDIIEFVNNNNIKKLDFYNKPLRFNKSINYNTIKRIDVNYPTLKQIYNNRVFNQKEKLILNQRYFWTKYCFGNHVSFKDVVANWDKELDINQALSYLNKKFYVNPDWFTECKVWQDYVEKTIIAINNNHRKRLQEAIDKSSENYKEAIAKLKDLTDNDNTLFLWRSRSPILTQTVHYRKFIPSRKRNEFGEWIDACVTSTNRRLFSNIQLRLRQGKPNIIETSNGASVTLQEGVQMFKLFLDIRKRHPNEYVFTFEKHAIKVGIYNLRFIKYTQKRADVGTPFDFNDWLIQIGCHSIWMSDVINFIKHYNLEDIFGLKEINGKYNVYNDIKQQNYERN